MKSLEKPLKMFSESPSKATARKVFKPFQESFL